MCKLCDKTIYSAFGYINDYDLVVCDKVEILPNDLVGLKSLDISNNKHITFIPSNLVELNELKCSNTNITYINHEFTKLKHIDASGSKLFSIGPFYELRYLIVSNCINFNHISDKLTKLEELNINDTNISTIPDSLINLGILNCSNSKLSSISKHYTNLIELDCSNTIIDKLPNTLLQLQKINCSNTNITKIPGTYIYLEELYWASKLKKKELLPDTLIYLEKLVLYIDESHKYDDVFPIPDSYIKLKTLEIEPMNN